MFESRHRLAFSEEDVVNMFPVVKRLRVTGTDGLRLVQQAEALIEQGKKHLQLKNQHTVIVASAVVRTYSMKHLKFLMGSVVFRFTVVNC